MHNGASLFIFAAVLLIALGLLGFFTERRKHGREGVRHFMIWYVFAWPFMFTAASAVVFDLGWLYAVAVAIGVACYVAQFLDARRQAARTRDADGAVRDRP